MNGYRSDVPILWKMIRPSTIAHRYWIVCATGVIIQIRRRKISFWLEYHQSGNSISNSRSNSLSSRSIYILTPAIGGISSCPRFVFVSDHLFAVNYVCTYSRRSTLQPATILMPPPMSNAMPMEYSSHGGFGSMNAANSYWESSQHINDALGGETTNGFLTVIKPKFVKNSYQGNCFHIPLIRSFGNIRNLPISTLQRHDGQRRPENTTNESATSIYELCPIAAEEDSMAAFITTERNHSCACVSDRRYNIFANASNCYVLLAYTIWIAFAFALFGCNLQWNQATTTGNSTNDKGNNNAFHADHSAATTINDHRFIVLSLQTADSTVERSYVSNHSRSFEGENIRTKSGKCYGKTCTENGASCSHQRSSYIACCLGRR